MFLEGLADLYAGCEREIYPGRPPFPPKSMRSFRPGDETCLPLRRRRVAWSIEGTACDGVM